MYLASGKYYRRFLTAFPRDLPLEAFRRLVTCFPVTEVWRSSMVPSAFSQLLLVFRCGYEYVFTHPETTSMLTVTLSPAAINLFDVRHVQADTLAREAAEWALLNNRQNGNVDLSASSDDLSDFCTYYFQSEALAKRAC